MGNTESSHKDNIPSTIRFGAGADFVLKGVDFLGTIEGSNTTNESTDFHGGIETWLHDLLGLRTGVDNKDFNFGISVKYEQFQFDYAFMTDILEEGATHKIGVQVQF
jgi:hypothetical protein